MKLNKYKTIELDQAFDPAIRVALIIKSDKEIISTIIYMFI